MLLPPASRSTCTRAVHRVYSASRYPLRSVHHISSTRHATSFSGQHTFESLRLDPNVLKALRLAFPSIERPTPTQHQFIQAIVEGKDILLKDDTGTGKSFALALAVLSQTLRLRFESAVGSLLLVPHRDLALQYLHWIERIHHHMASAPPLPSLVQVLLRDTFTDPEEVIMHLRDQTPRILIATPQSLHGILARDPNALPLDRLNTVAVDEADDLIPIAPTLKDAGKMKKTQQKIKRHPGVTRLLLNGLYLEENAQKAGSRQPVERSLSDHDPKAGHHPQLIMLSATLRTSFRRFLSSESGWLRRDGRKVVAIQGDPSSKGSKESSTGKPQDEEDSANALGGRDIQHHVLVVTKDGGVRNVRATDLDASVEEIQARKAFTDNGTQVSPSPGPPNAVVSAATHASALNPISIEAIAETFALEASSVALLVLPSDAPVTRAVDELRDLGVNAHALDVVQEAKGRLHLMRRELGTRVDDPTLLVSTLASTRGMDLPELSHVFLLGILDAGRVDSYIHVAGRVGRFGRGGKVITVLEERPRVRDKSGELKEINGPKRVLHMLGKLQVAPAKLSHFE
ncbi:P-loop containing nucleoside triphosphate hydrolase protein [Epithele typhae]|uniref:P-loop containing nucleoside triphosphate hydrolase protein n=1 Tax=Epithele typhae TaxID=378194 RepID=UPI0020088051|nr:P-loop containing nucleoside triphosphate hydrolase protein [Epithele typhae]KAH9944132.1 P-loop containing nucleoside triphosphate hydrolase protein [Epithele typhae]